MNYKRNMKFSEGVEKYIEWGQRHYSARTLEMYVDHLRRFEKFIKNKDIEEMHVIDDVIGYTRHLEKRQIADSTINLAMISLRQMWKTLVALERNLGIQLPFLWGAIPIKKGVIPKSHKPVKIEDFRELLRVANQGNTAFMVARDTCMFRMLYDTGVRVSELTSLNVSSIQEGKQSAVVITRKRRDQAKFRQVFWTRETHKALLTYLDIRKHFTGSDALFISAKHGKRITTRWVQRTVKLYSEKAGIDPTTIRPHGFRHGWGMRAVEAEMHPAYVQAHMGHAHLASSQIYYNVRNVALEREYHKKIGDGATEEIVEENITLPTNKEMESMLVRKINTEAQPVA